VRDKIEIRPIRSDEFHALEEFLYHAIYLPPGAESVPKETIYKPEIFIYAKDFGSQKGDHGVVAVLNDEIIGAAWTRIIPAYGHINNDTPELAISVLPNYRARGIGTKLMLSLFIELKVNGFKQTSLSVQQDNPAVSFYKRLGYVITKEKRDFAGHDDFIMIKEL
jgi:ribosomal protein S18 acetylase RimI-like enzyme